MREDDRLELLVLEVVRRETWPFDAGQRCPKGESWESVLAQYERLAVAGYIEFERSSCYESGPIRYTVHCMTRAGVERLDALGSRAPEVCLRALMSAVVPCLLSLIQQSESQGKTMFQITRGKFVSGVR